MFVPPPPTSPAASVANAALSDLLARRRLLVPLQEALDATPVGQKVEYLEALRVCPSLVETESDPIYFLEFASFDAKLACARLLSYWRNRRRIFGPRAYLPLDLSGSGALTTQDISFIKLGVFAPLLPDSAGCPVLFIDHDRAVDSKLPFECELRAHFFFWNLLLRQQKARTEGVVCLFPPPEQWMKQEQMNETIGLLEHGLPLQVKALHMLFMREDKQTLVQAVIPKVVKYFGFLGRSVIMHNFDSMEQLQNDLSSHGIARENLPTTFGGMWRYDRDLPFLLSQHGLSSPLALEASSYTSMMNSASYSNTVGQSASGEGSLGLLQQAAALSSSRRGSLPAPLQSPSPPYAAASSLGTSPPIAACITAASRTPVGTREMYNVTPAVKARGLKNLNDAIKLMPIEESAPYFQALRRAPHLVEKESNPLKMLIFDEFNAWTAAKRLCRYWETRVQVFQDRAFLPLTMTPTSALLPSDIDAIRSGYWSFPSTDAAGRLVVCYDAAKRRQLTLQSRMRITFYVYHIVCENDLSQTDGYVGFLVLDPSMFAAAQMDGGMQACIDIVVDCFPCRFSKFHIVYPPQQSSGGFSFMSHVLPFVLKVLARLLDPKSSFHVGDTKEQLLAKLATHGLIGSSVPGCVGGTFGDTEFVRWLRNRELTELGLFGQQSHSTASDSEESIALPVRATSFPVSSTDVSHYMQYMETNEKLAYLQAVEKCPELVSKESDPARFVRAAGFDLVAAAKLLASYWTIRNTIFGDRAFLPMDQTGDGALERKDIAVLQTGYLVQLPNDSRGCSVICCDGSRLQKATRVSQLRCSFYIWSCVNENALSQSVGYSVLYTITEPSFDRANRECFGFAMKAHPVKLNNFHVLGAIPEDSSADSFLEGPVQSTVQNLDTAVQNRIVIHTAASRSMFAEKLAAHGISRSGLPRTFGGSWGFQEFVQWQELRIRHEWSLPIGAGTRDAARSFHIPTAKDTTELTEAERTERKRRMNVIHSRRKRERERIEVEGLHEQCAELRDRNKRLSSENRRLNQLLSSARDIV